MPYLDWDTYQSMGEGNVSEEAFPSAEAWAEAMLDLWTLDRLHVVDWSEWADRVHVVMCRLVDSRSAVEAEEGGSLLNTTAEHRMGKPEELGYALATVADERNGYLAGVDVLCDGGSTNGMKEFKKSKK